MSIGILKQCYNETLIEGFITSINKSCEPYSIFKKLNKNSVTVENVFNITVKAANDLKKTFEQTTSITNNGPLQKLA